MASSEVSQHVIENEYNHSKRKRKNIMLKKVSEDLNLSCDWHNCTDKYTSSHQYYNHVSRHLKDITIGEDENGEFYVCNWKDCNFQSKDNKEMVRHLKYHAYMASLKALGRYVSIAMQLPACSIQSEFNVRKRFPDYNCHWDSCEETSAGIQEFINHVHHHVKSQDRKECNFMCEWSDCNSRFPKMNKLLDHIRTHTKECYIACPNCGSTFTSKTQFADHCLSQKPLEEHTYQCDYCHSLHPTERILRNHMWSHINHIKCSFCDMTCITPSVLASHVRYRHLNYKPFKCTICDNGSKSKADFQAHLMSHMCGNFVCPEEDCDYSTTTESAFRKHSYSAHVEGKQSGMFSCHMCGKKYTKGTNLTKHLSKQHNLNKPPGYSRFQYKLESDGCRRLQTVRLESIDASQLDNNEVSPHENIDADQITCFPSTSSDVSNVITVDFFDDKGQVVSTNVLVPEQSLPPLDAEIIAIGS